MAEYTDRLDATDGQHLIENTRFVAALNAIAGTTRADAAQARVQADIRQRELATAERRRAMVEDRIKLGQAALTRAGQAGPAPATSRKPNWHGT
jgi:hypothetical protein